MRSSENFNFGEEQIRKMWRPRNGDYVENLV